MYSICFDSVASMWIVYRDGEPIQEFKTLARAEAFLYDEPEYDESMDGDFDSAMTSAGFGTDEDYGYYGDE